MGGEMIMDERRLTKAIRKIEDGLAELKEALRQEMPAAKRKVEVSKLPARAIGVDPHHHR
jgi:hypothetical protein